MLLTRVAALTLLTAALALTQRAHAADDTEPGITAGKTLLKEGDDLADKADTNQAVLKYKQAFEKLLPVMRKLPFKTEVKRDVTAREALKDFLVKELDEDSTPGEFRAMEMGMKALGFLPRNADLKATMVQVYSEEIAAFYDPRTKTMHLIREPEVKEKDKKPVGFLDKLLGRTGGFDKDQNKTVLAHELTHALADQHYDLAALQKAAKGNDDAAMAVSALIEGEATLTMMAAQMDDWQGKAITVLPSADLERTMSFIMPFMKFAGGASLKKAPPVLIESLVFPYLRGLVFVSKLTNDKGWEGIDEAYKNPPLSTEQILHPEKYQAKPDVPTLIDLGTLDAGPDWKELGRNVVGEMQTSVLLNKHGGKKAAAGWDGDRYAVFEKPGGKLGLVWALTWDTEEDAKEFAQGYARFQATKMNADAETPDQPADALRRSVRGTDYAIDRRGVDVTIVEGFDTKTTLGLIEAGFKAKKSEMTRP
ncbi:hypothetical protein EP7_001276 [Isosphaeraceae bacterium EP7]